MTPGNIHDENVKRMEKARLGEDDPSYDETDESYEDSDEDEDDEDEDETCDECGHVLVDGVCINDECPKSE